MAGLSSDSILDKVLSSQAFREGDSFEPWSLVNELINKNLPSKEADIVLLRHGLRDGEPKTLKEVGSNYNITRERVRQIERLSLNKLKIAAQKHAGVIQAKTLINQILEDHGGALDEENLLKKILTFTQNTENNLLAVKFLLHNILDDKFQYIAESDNNFAYWKTPLFSPQIIEQIVGLIKPILERISHPLSRAELWSEVIKESSYNQEWSRFDEKQFFSSLTISKKIRANIFDEWGLQSWKTIIPKRMNDKIFLALQKAGRPMHFREIADEINKFNFDKKKAYPATIHNELILNKNRYVLVGRGIYALSDWGYKHGVVADVVKEILSLHPEGLTKDQVISEVLKKRQVKTGTIYLALMNKKLFEKRSGRYFLVDLESENI